MGSLIFDLNHQVHLFSITSDKINILFRNTRHKGIYIANRSSNEFTVPLAGASFNSYIPIISLGNGFHDWHIKVLIIITALGAILRFYHLGYNSLWLDEAATYSFAQKSLIDIWGFTFGGEFNPPLFYWVEHCMLFLGKNEVILRLVPAVVGVLTIPLFYLIGEEFMDRNMGLIAAAILSLSPVHIYYSQEARAYTSVLFLISLALICYLYGQRSNRSSYWILFGFFLAAAFWTHFYSIVAAGALILFGFIEQFEKSLDGSSKLKQIPIGLASFIVLCAPLLVIAMRLFLIRTSSRPAFGLHGMDFIIESIWEIFGCSNYTELVLIVLFIIGIIQLSYSEINKALLMITVITITFIVSLGLSYKMPMMPRYILFLLPLFYSGAAAAYKPLTKVIPRRLVVCSFLIILLLLNAQFYNEYYNNYFKSDWRDFSKELQNMTENGDIIIVLPAYIKMPLNYYYNNTTDHTIEFGASTKKDLESLYGFINHSRVFFVITDDLSAADPSGKSRDWLKAKSRNIPIKSAINGNYTSAIELRENLYDEIYRNETYSRNRSLSS